ncbi:hypothetical protein FORC54_4088 [Vibrio vulnificus]|nr:hypothetical protein FORC54_4088 [Vibrio vulnificus]
MILYVGKVRADDFAIGQKCDILRLLRGTSTDNSPFSKSVIWESLCDQSLFSDFVFKIVLYLNLT